MKCENALSNRKPPSRRDFIKISVLSAATLTHLPSLTRLPRARKQTPAPASTLPNGVAAGDVTQTSAVLWTHSTALGTVKFEYVPARAAFDPFAIQGRPTAEVTDPTLPVKVQITKLQPATEYVYHVTDAAGTRLSGRFLTLPVDGAQVGLHFGVTGDWRGELRPYMSLSNVAALKLDFFMEHGDTIYADVPSLDFPADHAVTLADFRVKHNEVYSARYEHNIWADIRASTSVYVINDDHEVCDNFAGGAPPSSDPRFDKTGSTISQTHLYQNGIQAFQEYNPLRDEVYTGTHDPRVDGRPKFYRSMNFGSTAAVLILDARAFRDKEEPQLSELQVLNPFALKQSLASVFEPNRTMLGRPQLDTFKADLLAAHQAGILWKFIMLPEPIQNMGWLGGVDRWEGYSVERTEVLKFIEDNAIRNVVFISADVHTTFINNLTYQLEAGGEHLPTHCFEISTECAAYHEPTGQMIVEEAAQIGLLPADQAVAYARMSIPEKDALLEGLFNSFVLAPQGFTPLGLEDSLIQWQRIKGGWVVGHSYGWSEFEVAPDTRQLTITTYGVPVYSPRDAAIKSEQILAYVPQVYSQLIITPQTT